MAVGRRPTDDEEVSSGRAFAEPAHRGRGPRESASNRSLQIPLLRFRQHRRDESVPLSLAGLFIMRRGWRPISVRVLPRSDRCGDERVQELDGPRMTRQPGCQPDPRARRESAECREPRHEAEQVDVGKRRNRKQRRIEVFVAIAAARHDMQIAHGAAEFDGGEPQTLQRIRAPRAKGLGVRRRVQRPPCRGRSAVTPGCRSRRPPGSPAAGSTMAWRNSANLRAASSLAARST